MMVPPARHAASTDRSGLMAAANSQTWPAGVGVLHAEVGVPALLRDPQARAVNGDAIHSREKLQIVNSI